MLQLIEINKALLDRIEKTDKRVNTLIETVDMLKKSIIDLQEKNSR